MTPKTAALLADPHPKTHILYPYSNFQQIVPAVARFIGKGIRRGESVVLIVTAEPRAGIHAQLKNNDLDGGSLERAGRIIFINAAGSMGDPSLKDAPDSAAFDSIAGAAVRRGIAKSPVGKVRIYGEMVNELCSSGRAESAARMEELWNTLDEAQSAPVLCSYSLDTLLPPGEDVGNRILHAHNGDLSPGEE